jgi:hypothetical protein
MELECESSHPSVERGMVLLDAMALSKKDLEDAIDAAEREAIDKGFDAAMNKLSKYKCKGNCERRFAIRFDSRSVVLSKPEKANGSQIYRAVVLVPWKLDIECKHPKPGSGIPHGGME